MYRSGGNGEVLQKRELLAVRASRSICPASGRGPHAARHDAARPARAAVNGVRMTDIGLWDKFTQLG